MTLRNDPMCDDDASETHANAHSDIENVMTVGQSMIYKLHLVCVCFVVLGGGGDQKAVRAAPLPEDRPEDSGRQGQGSLKAGLW